MCQVFNTRLGISSLKRLTTVYDNHLKTVSTSIIVPMLI